MLEALDEAVLENLWELLLRLVDLMESSVFVFGFRTFFNVFSPRLEHFRILRGCEMIGADCEYSFCLLLNLQAES